jgi:hypothetical protein
MLYIQGGSLAFVGITFDDSSFSDRGEKLFQDAVRLGELYPKNDPEYFRVLNQTSFARVQYASYYWNRYKRTDPERIDAILRPLIEDPQVKQTPLYTQNLASHKDSTVPPSPILRDIAKQMPELKTFLVGLGWKF